MRRRIRAAITLLCCALLLSGCRDPEAQVHSYIRHDAAELSLATADLAHREGLQDHKRFSALLQNLPSSTTRGFGDFRWQDGTLYVLVSFGSYIQKTEAEGAGSYSALSCAELTVDSETVKLVSADCPAGAPLEYGSSDVADYRLPATNREVRSRWG